MEFDKSRIYTAVNADELPIGSKCIFSNTIRALREKVQGEYECVGSLCDGYAKLVMVYSDDHTYPFLADNDLLYIYAYLIEAPKKTEYRPFESVADAMEAIKAHGGWIKYKLSASYSLVIAYGSGSIYINEKCIYMKDLFDDYVFADDGSPCGVPVEG